MAVTLSAASCGRRSYQGSAVRRFSGNCVNDRLSFAPIGPAFKSVVLLSHRRRPVPRKSGPKKRGQRFEESNVCNTRCRPVFPLSRAAQSGLPTHGKGRAKALHTTPVAKEAFPPCHANLVLRPGRTKPYPGIPDRPDPVSVPGCAR